LRSKGRLLGITVLLCLLRALLHTTRRCGLFSEI